MPTVQAALAAHFQAIRDTHLRELFAQDPARFERFFPACRRYFAGLFQEPDYA